MTAGKGHNRQSESRSSLQVQSQPLVSTDDAALPAGQKSKLAAKARAAQRGSLYCKVYCGNLNFKTTNATLRRHFEQFGEVVEAVAIRDMQTGKAKGFGFVLFENEEAAALACCDPDPSLDGRQISVKLAAFGRGKRDDSRARSHGSSQFSVTEISLPGQFPWDKDHSKHLEDAESPNQENNTSSLDEPLEGNNSLQFASEVHWPGHHSGQEFGPISNNHVAYIAPPPAQIMQQYFVQQNPAGAHFPMFPNQQAYADAFHGGQQHGHMLFHGQAYDNFYGAYLSQPGGPMNVINPTDAVYPPGPAVPVNTESDGQVGVNNMLSAQPALQHQDSPSCFPEEHVPSQNVQQSSIIGNVSEDIPPQWNWSSSDHSSAHGQDKGAQIAHLDANSRLSKKISSTIQNQGAESMDSSDTVQSGDNVSISDKLMDPAVLSVITTADGPKTSQVQDKVHFMNLLSKLH